jgi:hypothetical protein
MLIRPFYVIDWLRLDFIEMDCPTVGVVLNMGKTFPKLRSGSEILSNLCGSGAFWCREQFWERDGGE